MMNTTQKLTVAALAALSAVACTPVKTVYIYQPRPTFIPVHAAVSCQQHASMAQVSRYGANFQVLQVNPVGLLAVPVVKTVGTQPVAMALDGTADLWRRGEYTKVHWHCLVNARGDALYSYVRDL